MYSPLHDIVMVNVASNQDIDPNDVSVVIVTPCFPIVVSTPAVSLYQNGFKNDAKRWKYKLRMLSKIRPVVYV